MQVWDRCELQFNYDSRRVEIVIHLFLHNSGVLFCMFHLKISKNKMADKM